jgi:hypothetical protein
MREAWAWLAWLSAAIAASFEDVDAIPELLALARDWE